MRLVRSSHAFVAAVLLLLTISLPAGTQQNGRPVLIPPPQGPLPANNDPKDRDSADPALKSIEQRQARARNDERQKRLVADTDKLLALATQLHEDVGRTDKNILSIDVVKRAEEIEKLARSVKERMKG